MAAPIVIAVTLDTGDAQAAAGRLADAIRSALNGVNESARRTGQNINDTLGQALRNSVKKLGSELSSLGQQLSISVTLPLTGVAVAALKAAADLDKNRQTLVALTGSLASANSKLEELRNLASSAPGVTSAFAVDLFSQFKAIGTITDQSINQVIKSLGRLNAVFSLPDPAQFARNLQQIFTQGFERADIKEALGQVPIFEQLLEQAFGTRDAAKLRQLKEAGKLTAESYFQGISTAIDTRFPQVQESILARFQKTRDQLLVSLVPLGESIITTLQPIVERIIPQIQALLAEFAKLPPSTQEWIVKLGLLAVTLGPVLAALGSFLTILTSMGSLRGVLGGGGLIGAFAALNPVTVALGVAAAGAAIGYFSLQRAIKSVSDQADQALRKQREATGEFESLAGQPITRRGGRFIDAQQVQAGQAAATAAGGVLQTSGVNLLTGEPIRPEPARPAAAATTPASVEAIKRAVEEARKLKESLLRLEQERVEQTARLLNAETDERTRILKAQFSAGLTEYAAYYAELQGLEERRSATQAETVAAQAALIKQEITQLEQARSTARGAERVDIERQLLQLYTDQKIKVIELTDALNQNTLAAINRVKTTVQLAGGNIQGPQLTTFEPPPPPPGPTARELAEAAALDLRRQQVAVENQIASGILDQAEGRRQINEILRQERDLRQASLLAELKQLDLAPDRRAQIQLELEGIRNLGVELTAAQRFMRGFGSEIESVGDIFERFGQNLSRSFANVKGLLNNLKQSITQFFRDLLGQGLQRVFQQLFGSLTGAIFGSAGGGTTGGAGGATIGGTIVNLAGAAIGGNFGGGGGGIGSIFNIGGNGGFLTPGFGGGFPQIGLPGASQAGPAAISGGGSAVGGVAQAGILAGLAGLFKGFGFGRAAGSARGPLAAIAPFLGAQLGSSLGGPSGLGRILGGVGGAALGIGITAAPAALLAGGSLSALGGLAPLFSNPITAGVGAALLVGSFLLGRSQQRRNDEEQSGIWLTDAVNQIGQLRDQVRNGQVSITQARQIFESQILATFIANIQTLKTQSVRESRLTNQVRDLRNLFESTVATQAATGAKVIDINDKLIPEFATGGIVPGIDRGFDSVLARVRPGEMVLTRGQQSAIQGLAGPGVFRAAGVPEAAQMTARGPLFANGGMLRTLSQPALINTPYATVAGRGSDQPITLDVQMNLVVGREDATRLVVSGQTTSAGQRSVVGIVRKAILEREF